MGKKVILIDDVDGKEIDGGFEAPVEFSFNGKHYQIDLRQTNFDKFEKVMNPWIEAATEVVDAPPAPGRRGRPAGSSNAGKRPDTGSGRSKEELANIREWLKKEGHEVNERGRIRGELLDMYDRAHAAA
ncbi:Lsr2 family protein [Nocardia rhizosphaerihabitans]|uniref:histone-like nucleoid-structuring protein Lsr2 n=1 Tax=Nocardia rhizosphaerihabitans TaxID=1691570 RepID=UPI00366E19CC